MTEELQRKGPGEALYQEDMEKSVFVCLSCRVYLADRCVWCTLPWWIGKKEVAGFSGLAWPPRRATLKIQYTHADLIVLSPAHTHFLISHRFHLPWEPIPRTLGTRQECTLNWIQFIGSMHSFNLRNTLSWSGSLCKQVYCDCWHSTVY